MKCLFKLGSFKNLGEIKLKLVENVIQAKSDYSIRWAQLELELDYYITKEYKIYYMYNVSK
jgi:hypothetical protein